MERFDGPARELTIVVVLAILGLLGLLLAWLVQFLGAVGAGIALFLGLVLVVILVAVVMGRSLEVAFSAFAHAVGLTRSVILGLTKRLRR